MKTRIVRSFALIALLTLAAGPVGADVCNGKNGCGSGGSSGGGGGGAGPAAWGKLSVKNATASQKSPTTRALTSVAEGQSCAFTLHREGNASRSVAVSFHTRDGTAHAGSDYEGRDGRARLRPGRRNFEIRVQTNQDGLPEENERFSLVITEPTQGLIVDKKGVCEITDFSGGEDRL